MSLLEHYFNCPYCGESISMIVETGVDNQEYIEDCEVCCRPIDVRATCSDGQLIAFEATDNN